MKTRICHENFTLFAKNLADLLLNSFWNKIIHIESLKKEKKLKFGHDQKIYFVSSSRRRKKRFLINFFFFLRLFLKDTKLRYTHWLSLKFVWASQVSIYSFCFFRNGLKKHKLKGLFEFEKVILKWFNGW